MSWLITARNTLPLATGGNTVADVFIDGRMYRVHTFTTVGTSSLTVVRGGEFEYLVVAGGGGAGALFGGGGGAGGYRCSVLGESSGEGALAESPLSLATGSFTVTVGGGNSGQAGSNSVFATITSIGGGRGGGTGGAATTGGAGGGGGPQTIQPTGAAGTANQGFAGGSSPTTNSATAGGGGAGGVGSNAILGVGGAGGIGLSSNITGVSVLRGVGGKGANVNEGNPLNGAANTGNGAQGSYSGSAGITAAGGSGIVIVRYAIA